MSPLPATKINQLWRQSVATWSVHLHIVEDA
jgi:hypothetical protein